tara:strand:- start:1356 stop:1742 length:387 start_codon:yes stop_codon:yes gene_type:complete
VLRIASGGPDHDATATPVLFEPPDSFGQVVAVLLNEPHHLTARGREGFQRLRVNAVHVPHDDAGHHFSVQAPLKRSIARHDACCIPAQLVDSTTVHPRSVGKHEVVRGLHDRANHCALLKSTVSLTKG